jgi:hypothetical protein
MGGTLSIPDISEQQKNVKILRTDYPALSNNISDTIQNSDYNGIYKYNLKRLCCNRTENNTAYITVPVLNIDKISDLEKDTTLSNIEKTIRSYSTIKITVDNLTDELCNLPVLRPTGNEEEQKTFTKEKYIPFKSGGNTGDVCDKFYQSFCSNLYNDRVKQFGTTTTASYFIPPIDSKNPQDYYSANWFSDCNCYNSILDKKPTDVVITRIDPGDFTNYSDSNCGNTNSHKTIMKPYWNQRIDAESKLSKVICNNILNVSDNKAGNNLNLSDINMNNSCSNTSKPTPADNGKTITTETGSTTNTTDTTGSSSNKILTQDTKTDLAVDTPNGTGNNVSTNTSSSVGNTTTPPAAGNTTTPPAAGNTTTPPAAGNTTTPPEGSETTPTVIDLIKTDIRYQVGLIFIITAIIVLLIVLFMPKSKSK